MEYTVLGKTGLKISRLGLGGIPIQKVDAKDTTRLIDEMLKEGVNYIDTARGYTVSEEYLGQALEGRREHFVLATKNRACSKDEFSKAIDTSLAKLRTDYIDLYQIHNPSEADFKKAMEADGCLQALMEAREAGKIGHIGVTAHSLEVFKLALNEDWVETIMFPANIVEYQGKDLIRRCKEKNIGFIAMKPLAGGAIDNAELALRYLFSDPCVTVVIPGMAEVRELKKNVAASLRTEPLSEDELKACEEVRKTLGNDFCRRCNYCAPCTMGINIPSVFLFAGYLERYGLAGWAKERYATLPKNASDCISCGQCEPRCPYKLPISEKMKKIAKEFA